MPIPQGREQKETSSLEITDDKSSQSITVDDHFLPVSDSMVSLETDDVRVDISVGNGVTIESIYDKVLSHDYLVNGVSLFKYTIFTDLDSLSLSAWKSEGIALSKNSVKPIEVLVNENRNALQLEAVSKNNDLAFHIEIFFTDSMSFDISLSITSYRDDKVFFRASMPTVTMLNVKQQDAEIMIPQEAGWVTRYDGESHMGYTWLDTISGSLP